jgi:Tfp pilus assembly protein FimT
MIAARRFNQRVAMTLMELLIVVVILAIAASLAVPTIQRAFSSQRVEKAANLVRSGMNLARVKSMRSGKVFGFYYYPDTREYRVAPFNNDTMNLLKTQRRREIAQTGSNFDYGDELLPQGIVFLDGETIADSRSEQVKTDTSFSTSDVKPVLFYPDGSSQTAKVMLRCDDEYIEVHLRGMTGTSTVAAVDENRIPNSGR